MIDRCEDCLQNACMPSISVRNVPEATRDALAAKAAQAGQSLQEYLLAQLMLQLRDHKLRIMFQLLGYFLQCKVEL